MDSIKEEQQEIRVHFRQQQERYAYYVIALSVTAIGFSVYKTSGLPLSYSQIPLGFAVIAWVSSIFCGLKFLQFAISTLYTNNEYLNVHQGLDEVVGTDPDRIASAKKGMIKAMEQNTESTQKYNKWQHRFLYSGVLLFMIWHVFEMFKRTSF